MKDINTMDELVRNAQQSTQQSNPYFEALDIRMPVTDIEYDTISNMLSKASNPEEETYRIASALSFSRNTDIDFPTAYANLDALTEAQLGIKYTPNQTSFKAIQSSYKLGQLSMQRGNLGLQYKEAWQNGDEATMQSIDQQIQAIDAQMLEMQYGMPKGATNYIFQVAAQNASYMSSVFVKGAEYGMVGTMLGTAVAKATVASSGAKAAMAAVGGSIGFPAMAGVAAVAILASAYGRFKEASKVTEGNEFYDMIHSEGIKPEIAESLSTLSGNLSGAIEAILGDTITAGLSAMGIPVDSIASQLTTRLYASGKLGRLGLFATQMGVSTVSEGAEEAVDSFAGDAVTALGRLLSDLDPNFSLSESGKKAAKEFMAGAAANLLYGPLPTALNIRTDVKNLQAIRNLAVVTPSKEVFMQMTENVAPEGMNSKDWYNVRDNIYEKAEDVRNVFGMREYVETAEMDLPDIDEVAETDEEVEQEATKPRSGNVERKKDGSLNLQRSERTTRLPGDEGYRHIMKIGSANSSERYGHIEYDVKGNDLTIRNVRFYDEYNDLREEAVRDFLLRNRDYDIHWDTDNDIDEEVKQNLIDNNPNGPEAGLQYGSTDFNVDDNLAVQKKLNLKQFSKDPTEIKAMATLVQMQASTMGLTGEEFIDKYLGGEIRNFTSAKLDAARLDAGRSLDPTEEELDAIAKGELEEITEDTIVPGGLREQLEGIDLDMQKRAMTIWKGTRAIVYAGKYGNPTSFEHEMVHVIMRLGEHEDQFQKVYDKVRNTDQFKNYVDANHDIIHATSADLENMFNGEWGADEQEFVADLFESYRRNEQSVDTGLRHFFNEVANWFRQIYNTLKNAGTLNDEVREYFDALYGTAEDLRAKRGAEGVGVNRSSDEILAQEMSKLDQEYFKAIEEGEAEKLEQMVREAAEKNGFGDAWVEHGGGYTIRTKPAPKKTIKVYKVFTVDGHGRPTALFVNSGIPLPMGVWLDAVDTFHFQGKRAYSKDGGLNWYVPSTKNKNTEGGATGETIVIQNAKDRQDLIDNGFKPSKPSKKYSFGTVTGLAYRPGWHAGDLPFFPQGGVKIPGVSYGGMAHRYNQVVFECEMSIDTDYSKGHNTDSGKWQWEDMREIPENGSYRFLTNPLGKSTDIGTWYIGGTLKINRALSEAEVNSILAENNKEPQVWQSGKKTKTVGPLNLEALNVSLEEQFDGDRKTLAPITYDENGEIIPLSKRFDTSKPNDILFQDDTDEIQSIVETAKQNGTYMKAPNGADTNLDERQWAQVRTKAFKEWFGDWENDPENASKIVDENGEPKIFYHGVRPNIGNDANWTVFDKERLGFLSLTDEEWYASKYAQTSSEEKYKYALDTLKQENLSVEDKLWAELVVRNYESDKEKGRLPKNLFVNMRNPLEYEDIAKVFNDANIKEFLKKDYIKKFYPNINYDKFSKLENDYEQIMSELIAPLDRYAESGDESKLNGNLETALARGKMKAFELTHPRFIAQYRKLSDDIDGYIDVRKKQKAVEDFVNGIKDNPVFYFWDMTTSDWQPFWRDVLVPYLEFLGYDGFIYPEEAYGPDYTYGVFEPNQIKSATNNNGDYSRDNDSILYQSIGAVGAENLDEINRASSNLDNLVLAKQLYREHKDAKTIKAMTGWQIGAGNQWRMEITDDLKKINFENSEGKDLTVADIYDNPELLKAYPQLKDIHVAIAEIDNRLGGYYDPNINGIVINVDEAIKDRKRTFIHELQHAIQNIELGDDFYSSDPKSVRYIINQRLEDSQNELKERLNFHDYDASKLNHALNLVTAMRRWAKNPLSVLRSNYWYEYGSWSIPENKTDKLEYCRKVIEKIKEGENYNNFLVYAEGASRKILNKSLYDLSDKDLKNFVRRTERRTFADKTIELRNKVNFYTDTLKSVDYDLYHNTAIEVEARNTARRAITGDYDSLLYETEDVPRRSQILYQSIGMMGASSLDKWAKENGYMGMDVLSYLDTANKMKEAGATAEQVKFATGWEIGHDGEWRMDIPDYKEYLASDWGDFLEYKTLGDLYRNTKLYAAYPFLERVEVKFSNLQRENGSSASAIAVADSANNRILFNAKYIPDMTEDLFISTLVHEIQHLIQNEEGFANGSNPNMVQAYAVESELDLDTRVKRIQHTLAPYISFSRRISDVETIKRLQANPAYIKKTEFWFSSSEFMPTGNKKTEKAEYAKMAKIAIEALQDFLKFDPTDYNYENIRQINLALGFEGEEFEKPLEEYSLQELNNMKRRLARKVSKIELETNMEYLQELRTKYRDLLAAPMFEQYQRVAGEVEARATQAKLDKDTTTNLSVLYEDIPGEKIVVLPASGVISKNIFAPKILFQSADQDTIVAEVGGEMLITRSMRSDKIAKIKTIGGMPMPSLAISNKAHFNAALRYGPVTLIGNEKLAQRVVANQDTYSRDIWSPLEPSPVKKVDLDELRNIYKKHGFDMDNYEAIKDWHPLDLQPGRIFSYISSTESGFYMEELKKEIESITGNFTYKVEKGKMPQLVPYTAENITEFMKRDGIKGGNNDLDPDRYDVMMRVVSATRFKDWKHFKDNEYLLSRTTLEEREKEARVYDDFYKSNIVDAVEESIINYFLENEYDTEESVNNYLDSLSITDEDDRQLVKDYIEINRKEHTSYFEAKPQEVLQFSDFSAAMIPSDLPESDKAILREAGLELVEYSMEDRIQKTQEYVESHPSLLFQDRSYLDELEEYIPHATDFDDLLGYMMAMTNFGEWAKDEDIEDLKEYYYLNKDDTKTRRLEDPQISIPDVATKLPSEDISSIFETVEKAQDTYDDYHDSKRNTLMDPDTTIAATEKAKNSQFVSIIKNNVQDFLDLLVKQEAAYIELDKMFEGQLMTEDDIEAMEQYRFRKERAYDDVSPFIQNVMHSKKNLTDTSAKKVVSTVRKEVSAYRNIVADITGQEYWRSTEELAPEIAEVIDSNYDNMTVAEKRRAYQEALATVMDKKIKEGNNDDLKVYREQNLKAIKDLEAEIAELEERLKEEKKAYMGLELDRQDIFRKKESLDKEVTEAEKHIGKLDESIQAKAKKSGADVNLDDVKKAQTLKQKISALKLEQQKVDTQIKNNAVKDAKFREAWKAQKKLNDLRNRMEEKIAKLKEKQRLERELRKEDSYRQALIHSIMKPVAKSIAIDEAEQIMAIQAGIDPHNRKSMTFSHGPKVDINYLKRLFANVPDDPIFALLKPEQLERLSQLSLDEMTTDMLEDLQVTVDALRQLGRRKRQAYIDMQQRSVNHLRKLLTRQLMDSGKYIHDPIKGTKEEQKRKSRWIQKAKDIYGATINMARKAQMLDGDTKGLFYNLLIRKKRELQDLVAVNVTKRVDPILDMMKELGVENEDLYQNFNVEIDGESRTYDLSSLMYVYFSQFNEKNIAAVAFGELVGEAEKSRIDEEAWKMYPEKHNAKQREARADYRDKQISELGLPRYQELLEQAKEIVQSDERVFQIAKAIEKDFNSESFARVVELMRRMYNIDVKREDYYLPINREEFNGEEPGIRLKNDILGIIPGTRGSVEKGFTKERIEMNAYHQKRVDMDFFGLWQNSVFAQEHALANMKYVKELNSVFLGPNSSMLRDAIVNIYGENMFRDIETHIKEISNPKAFERRGVEDAAIRILRGNLYSAYLGYKVSGVVLQGITSPAPFLGKVNPIELMKGYIAVMLHPIESIDTINQLSPFMRDRSFDIIGKQIKDELHNMEVDSFGDKVKKKMLQFQNVGMMGLELIDRYAVAGGWLAIYNKNLAAGMDPMEAIRDADEYVRETQPLSDITELAPMFKNRNQAMQTITAFQSSMNVIWNNCSYDVRVDALKRHNFRQALGTIVGYMLAGALLELVREGFKDDDEEPLEGWDLMRRLVYSFTTQPVSGIPLVADFADAIAERVITGEKPHMYHSDLYPTVSSVYKAIDKAIDGDADKALQYIMDAVALATGMPKSGFNELKQVLKIGPEALLGRRDYR